MQLFTHPSLLVRPSSRQHPALLSAERPWPSQTHPRIQTDVFFGGKPPALNDALLPLFGDPWPYLWSIYPANGPLQEKQPLPAVRQALIQAKTLALGDLHGSFLKLVETLVAANLIWMPPKQARAFVAHSAALEAEVTDTRHWTNLSKRDKKPLRALEQALQHTIQSIRWIGGNRRLILLGDILNDRGPSDMVTLALLEQLRRQAGQNIVWVASNHDYNIHQRLFTPFIHHRSGYLSQLLHPRTYFQKSLPHLISAQLMHYTPATQTLYTHAPVTIRQINSLIGLMKQYQLLPAAFRYSDITSQTLPDFIEKANTCYREHLRQTAGHPLLKRDDVIYEFLTTRNALTDVNELAFKDKGVNVFVHGHDSMSTLQSPFSILSPIPHQVDYKVVNLNQHVRYWWFQKPLNRIGWDENTVYLES